MKKIGFIGAFDKIDMIINVAKILTAMGQKVLVVDSTVMQKAKYIVPTISPSTTYITDFEDIDVAVGFNTTQEIKNYIGAQGELPYDIILVDADISKRIEEFELYDSEKNYFVTAFDLYSLKRGLEILGGLTSPINLTKILFSKEMSKEEDEYLNFLSEDYRVVWSEYRIYFPLENGDSSVVAENQRVAKIKFKKLSAQYKDSLIFIVEEILKDVSENTIRKVIKSIERGV